MVNLLRDSTLRCLSCAPYCKALAILAALTAMPASSFATTPGNVVHDTYFLEAQTTEPFTT